MITAMLIFSPQETNIVLAEDQINQSVYDLIKDEKKEETKDNKTVEQEQEQEQVVQEDALSVTPFDFIKMFAALAFVLFLIYLLLKFVTKRNRLFQQGQSIVNLGGTSLGQSKSIQIIKVGNRVLVVGVGDSISLLKEIDDDDEREHLIDEFERKQEQLADPKDIIQKVANIGQQMLKAKRSNDNKTAFSSTFKEQLEKVKLERKKQLDVVKRKGLKKHE
jgi:flagellar protein FliO/FliZ